MKVFKFGGTSVKDVIFLRNICNIIKTYSHNNKLIIIVSAMGKITNDLEELLNLSNKKSDFRPLLEKLISFHLNIVKKLFQDEKSKIYDILKKLFFQLEDALNLECDLKMKYDQVVSFGELISTNIIAEFLVAQGINTQWIDARKFIQTNNTWKEAQIEWHRTEHIMKSKLQDILQDKIIITQGFIGGTIGNKTTTLGREGSDFSAAIFAYCMDAESVTTWKDVPGILNADPKRISDTILYNKLDYKDAAEMTYYGASVIHPKTIRPLALKNIPLYVKSFINPDGLGTCIGNFEGLKHKPALIFKSNQSILNLVVKDFSDVNRYNLSKVFNTLENLRIKVNLMSNSAISITICCNTERRKFDLLETQLEDNFKIQIKDHLELVTVKEFDKKIINKFKEQNVLWEQKIESEYHIVRQIEF